MSNDVETADRALAILGGAVRAPRRGGFIAFAPVLLLPVVMCCCNWLSGEEAKAQRAAIIAELSAKSAFLCCHALAESQASYWEANKRYASLSELVASDGLLDPDLADGKYSGYRFDMDLTETGYACTAMPIDPDPSGATICLFVNETGVVRYEEDGRVATIGSPIVPEEFLGVVLEDE